MSIHDIELTEENRLEIEEKDHTFVEFEYLATSHQPEVRELVAKNEYLPNKYALMMAEDEIVQVRTALAGNPKLSPEVIAILSKDKKIPVLKAVAQQISLEPSLIHEFAHHRSHPIRDAVSTNKSLPIDLLKLLSRDSQWGVRRSVATNPNVTTEILNPLVESGMHEELSAIAKNGAVQKEILQKLYERIVDSKDIALRGILEDIICHPNFPESFARDLYENLRTEGERRQANEDADGQWVREIERKSVASRQDLSANFVERLRQDPDYNVRATLAANPSIPDDILAQLALDEDKSVRTAVHKNQKASAETKATALLLGIDSSEDDN